MRSTLTNTFGVKPAGSLAPPPPAGSLPEGVEDSDISAYNVELSEQALAEIHSTSDKGGRVDAELTEPVASPSRSPGSPIQPKNARRVATMEEEGDAFDMELEKVGMSDFLAPPAKTSRKRKNEAHSALLEMEKVSAESRQQELQTQLRIEMEKTKQKQETKRIEIAAQQEARLAEQRYKERELELRERQLEIQEAADKRRDEIEQLKEEKMNAMIQKLLEKLA